MQAGEFRFEPRLLRRQDQVLCLLPGLAAHVEPPLAVLDAEAPGLQRLTGGGHQVQIRLPLRGAGRLPRLTQIQPYPCSRSQARFASVATPASITTVGLG